MDFHWVSINLSNKKLRKFTTSETCLKSKKFIRMISNWHFNHKTETKVKSLPQQLHFCHVWLLEVWFCFYIYFCVGQFCPMFKLWARKGLAQYPVWGQTSVRGRPAEELTKLPSEERLSMVVRNWAVSEDEGHLGTFVRGIWWTR